MAIVENSKTDARSLYECFHARVRGNYIYCQKGHPFHNNGSGNGTINIQRLASGRPLVMSVCQDCEDFECMGGAIPSEERGWLRGTAKYGATAWENREALGG